MGALRIERDGDVLRVTLARPETRNAFDAALIAELAEAFVDVGKARAVAARRRRAELLRRRRRRVDARVRRPRLRRERRRRERAARACSRRSTAAPRRSSRASRGTRSAAAPGSSRARTSRSPTRGRRVRVLGGEARDHPGGDLAVRAREDRAELRRAATSSPASASTPRRRCGSGSCTRSRPISTPRVERVLGELRSAGPRAARAAKRLVLDAARRPRDRAPDRRAAHERRGPGGPARVPRAPLARLGLAELDGDRAAGGRRRREPVARRPPRSDGDREAPVRPRPDALHGRPRRRRSPAARAGPCRGRGRTRCSLHAAGPRARAPAAGRG